MERLENKNSIGSPKWNFCTKMYQNSPISIFFVKFIVTNEFLRYFTTFTPKQFPDFLTSQTRKKCFFIETYQYELLEELSSQSEYVFNIKIH